MVPNGDRIMIPMGRQFNFSNLESIKIIESPMTFDGATLYDSGIDLMNEDKDWTLLIDAQFCQENASDVLANSVLVSCYNNINSKGFRLINSSNSESSTTPYIQ